jgi:hypothetical protein
MSSPRDSDSLSGQFWPTPVVPTHVFFRNEEVDFQTAART